MAEKSENATQTEDALGSKTDTGPLKEAGGELIDTEVSAKRELLVRWSELRCSWAVLRSCVLARLTPSFHEPMALLLDAAFLS